MAGASPVQTQEDLVPPPPITLGYRWAGMLLAAPVAVAVHIVLVGPFGIDLLVPDGPGSDAMVPLPVLTTLVVTLLFSAVAWIGVAVLERVLGGERGRTIWTVLAFAAFVVSLLPAIVLDIPLDAAWGLFAIHVAAALVLIPTMWTNRSPHAPLPGNPVAEAGQADEDTHAHPTPHPATDPASTGTEPASTH
jgi:hypothetical protein